MADERQTSDDVWAPWRSRIKASMRRTEDHMALWQTNVEKRRQTEDGPDALERTPVNKDWPLTKAKIAQLYSQTPEIRLTPRDERFRPIVPIFARELNDTLADINIGSTIEEVLADVVNASGIGAVLVSCETRTEPRDVPVMDPATLPPDQQLAIMQGTMELETTVVDHPVDVQHLGERISPADLLVPTDFTGSVYNKARWLGRRGRMTWAQSKNALGLDESQKDDVLGTDERAGGVQKSLNTDSTKFRDTEVVHFTELFYWRHYFHEEETNFRAIQRLVFVDGIDEPVINEPYRAQTLVEGRMAGVIRLPINVLTLTYISDDSLPPSDSSISRFQVNELEQSRDAMIQQRKHSIPIRWFDTNRVSSNTRTLLEKGTFQGYIPTNGPGDRAIGEVARASFPQEKFEFNHIIDNELTEQWQVGDNQKGSFASGERSAREAGIIDKNFQRRVGQEQDKVTRFLIGIAECVAGHLALYGTFELPDELGEERAVIANSFTYSVRVDSTVRLDAEQRIQQLERFYNLTYQSGYLNAKPIIEEWAELSGVAPDKVVVDPQPKAPEPIKVSVSKAEDLSNVLFMACLMATGQAPSPENLTAAKKLMAEAGLPIIPVVPPTNEGDPNAPPADVQTPGIRNAEAVEAPRINKRDLD